MQSTAPSSTPGFVKILSMVLTFLILRLLFEMITGDFMLSLFPAWQTTLFASSYRIPILVLLFLFAGLLVGGVFFTIRKLVFAIYVKWVK